ncbi:MAG: hypothetical protein ACMG57_03420, partial [Candidatus Dojkabacteria bacterium]
VTEIRTPIDTVKVYGPGICDYIRLPDHDPTNDSTVNQEVVDAEHLSSVGNGVYKSGNAVYDSKIDDEGDFYYDGGFVVSITAADGLLYRFVHVKNPQVTVGQKVEVGKTEIGLVYDGHLDDIASGPLAGKWSDYSVKPNDGSGCFDTSNAHLHFAIIDKVGQSDPLGFYTGNQINSTPWVKQYCHL